MNHDEETWACLAEQPKAKRASNRDSSAKLLAERSYYFTSHNQGAHLVVSHEGLTVDFWPGTGKWICRTTGVTSRGVFNLVKHLDT